MIKMADDCNIRLIATYLVSAYGDISAPAPVFRQPQTQETPPSGGWCRVHSISIVSPPDIPPVAGAVPRYRPLCSPLPAAQRGAHPRYPR